MAAALSFMPVAVSAQEHPKGQEHPKEHPSTKSVVSKETLAKAVKDYVEKESQKKGGYYEINDSTTNKTLKLTLVKVHDDRLSKVAEGTYFACADFKSTDNQMYDLDIFMKEGKSGLETTEVTIHKENGKPRYNWQEEKGVWKKVAMK
jgi:hypothetical protein